VEPRDDARAEGERLFDGVLRPVRRALAPAEGRGEAEARPLLRALGVLVERWRLVEARGVEVVLFCLDGDGLGVVAFAGDWLELLATGLTERRRVGVCVEARCAGEAERRTDVRGVPSVCGIGVGSGFACSGVPMEGARESATRRTSRRGLVMVAPIVLRSAARRLGVITSAFFALVLAR